MQYISTRGQVPAQKFCDILLEGLAADGGLYLPQSYPQISAADLAAWQNFSYADLAIALLSRFIDDIPAADLQRILAKTYTAEVYGYSRKPQCASAITPLTPLTPGLYLLELSNGPTLAFKDMAMQLLGNLFEYVLDARGQELNILGATSGDTGSAAEYAIRGKRNLRIFMLSPHGKMSAFQRAQMYSLTDTNVYNIAISAMFDDCQDIVKAVSNDAAFKARYHIGAVNSINWARVAAQVVYYFKAYFVATRELGAPVSFAVPTGNFGNICAGHIARQMGLPIARLVLATNENDVLDEFFKNGVYRPRTATETRVTSSPSMDISRASNFERFMFDLVQRDVAVLQGLWRQLETTGMFDISATPYFARLATFGFVSGGSCHADRLRTIRETWQRQQILIDPHTSDALYVAQQYLGDEPMVVLETAQPTKFSETIMEAVGFAPPYPRALADIESRPQRVELLPAQVDAVQEFIAQHCH